MGVYGSQLSVLVSNTLRHRGDSLQLTRKSSVCSSQGAGGGCTSASSPSLDLEKGLWALCSLLTPPRALANHTRPLHLSGKDTAIREAEGQPLSDRAGILTWTA